MQRFTSGLAAFLCLAVAGCGKSPDFEQASAPSDEASLSAPAGPTGQPEVSVAWTLDQRDLLPENIAQDPVTGDFYVGSSRYGKIVKVTPEGAAKDFAGPRQDGLWMVMGMKVDAERRHLWVASADGDNLTGYTRSRTRPAGVFQFDLEDGTLLGKWLLDGPRGTHFFNDLVVTPEGDVYVTHMFNQAAVYIIDDERRELEVFARPGNFRAPNGIAWGALDRDSPARLYVAHREGLSAFDPATAERRLLDLPADAAFTPIDGLYLEGGSLIGVHPEEGKIRRFVLDDSGFAVTAIETLVESHPAIGGLTTGVVADKALYFVANSQFDRLTEGRLPPAEELDDIVVLKLPLPSTPGG